ncbi:MAG TPA: OmpA family protein [Sedimentisphaerales bacterium]|nr:OmpA family protein [Sedimentisphaerales bacterium]
MPTANKKTIALLIGLVSVAFSSGCTDWQKKHNALNVEHQNLKGLYEREQADKGQLAEQLTQSQQTIEDLQKQIALQKKSPAEATGFGKGYDVAFDPSAGTITVTLENTILFSPGKAELKKTSAELDHIESVLRRKYAGKQIDVVGHTDSDPVKKSKKYWQDNWELSAERALAVVRYLVKRGIPEEKIRAVGCGAARPVADNTSAKGKAKNRRVEIVVYIKSRA